MPMIFISHSSEDKEFARKLASDLRDRDFEVWFDDIEIRVGDSIPTEIEKGLSEADYVVIVLSPHAVASGWVEKEWQAKFVEEVRLGTTMLLPVLIENCEIPPLLKSKRFADFREDYETGLTQLTEGMVPIIRESESTKKLESSSQDYDAVSELLSKAQSQSSSLAQCLAEALTLAVRTGNKELEDFCRVELSGWQDNLDMIPSYRVAEVYVSKVVGELNMQYLGWGENPGTTVFQFIRQHQDDFLTFRTPIPFSVSKLESQADIDPQKSILSVPYRLGDLDPSVEDPEMAVPGYTHAGIYQSILTAVRQELTFHLLGMMPSVRGKEPS